MELIEKYGINEILKLFLRDLNILSSGIVLSTQSVNSTVKGALLTFLADTQASQLLGGFKNCVCFPCVEHAWQLPAIFKSSTIPVTFSYVQHLAINLTVTNSVEA